METQLYIVFLAVYAALYTAGCSSTGIARSAAAQAEAHPYVDFFQLVGYGTLEQVVDAIKHGADVNKPDPSWGVTPLIRAAAGNKDPAVIEALIKAGADVEARNMSAQTPLMSAAGVNQNTEVCTVLLNAGAKIDDRDDHGKTAFIWACTYNLNPEVLLMLINAGADIEDRDDEGKTALIWAALYNQNPETIVVLLRAGANAKARDRKGNIALDYARNVKMLKGTSALELLEKASD